MVEPKDWRGVAIQLGEFRRYVLAFIGALIVAVSWGARELYVLNASVKGLSDQVTRIEGDLKEVRNLTVDSRTSAKRILEIVERIDERQQRIAPTPPFQPLTLSDGEAQLVRNRLGVPPLTAPIGKIKIGDALPETQTKPFPDDLVAKLPKLKGARFFVDDANNGVALVDVISNKVFAII
jgi:hypothetical protein